jgi:tRNA(Ile2) C34 agmatinyltransferase TiaS
MSMFDDGPGRLTCDRCGYDFDPLARDWRCPHCGLTWPWRFIRRMHEEPQRPTRWRLPAAS